MNAILRMPPIALSRRLLISVIVGAGLGAILGAEVGGMVRMVKSESVWLALGGIAGGAAGVLLNRGIIRPALVMSVIGMIGSVMMTFSVIRSLEIDGLIIVLVIGAAIGFAIGTVRWQIRMPVCGILTLFTILVGSHDLDETSWIKEFFIGYFALLGPAGLLILLPIAAYTGYCIGSFLNAQETPSRR